MSSGFVGPIEQRAAAMLRADPLDPRELTDFVTRLEITGHLPLGSLTCLTQLIAKAAIADGR